MRRSYRKPLLSLIVIACLYTPLAQAYLDPGTGSILLQSLLAAIAAALATLRLYWRKFKNLFKRKKDTPSETEKKPQDENTKGNDDAS